MLTEFVRRSLGLSDSDRSVSVFNTDRSVSTEVRATMLRQAQQPGTFSLQPSNLQTLQPSNPSTLQPPNVPTSQRSNFQLSTFNFQPSNLPTFQLSTFNLQPSNVPTFQHPTFPHFLPSLYNLPWSVTAYRLPSFPCTISLNRWPVLSKSLSSPVTLLLTILSRAM